MNAAGEIKPLDQFQPGEQVTVLSQEMADQLVKIDQAERHEALTKLMRDQFRKGSR